MTACPPLWIFTRCKQDFSSATDHHLRCTKHKTLIALGNHLRTDLPILRRAADKQLDADSRTRCPSLSAGFTGSRPQPQPVAPFRSPYRPAKQTPPITASKMVWLPCCGYVCAVAVIFSCLAIRPLRVITRKRHIQAVTEGRNIGRH